MSKQILSSPDQSLKKAVQWISENRQDNPNSAIAELIEKAGYVFDLSPKDLDFLFRKLDGSNQ